MQNRQQIEEKDDQPKKTCWSIFCSTLSMLSPKKLFIFYLLATAKASGIDNSISQNTETVTYLRYGNNRLFFAPASDVIVQPAPNCLLKIEGKDLDVRNSPGSPFIIRQVCHDTNNAFEPGDIRKELPKDVFEGTKFVNGKLSKVQDFHSDYNRKITTIESTTDFTKGKDVVERTTTTTVKCNR